ncbi:MAG: acetoacetate--CoA ligase [Woeseiaceae bacterium]|nr:acetoacetate--CoA ligase [Woeseiaceae bacterium]
MAENPVLWTPASDRASASQMMKFMREQGADSYDALYEWSIDSLEAFWSAFAAFADVRFHTAARTVLTDPASIMHAGWFNGATLNYAEHLLRHSGDRDALIFVGEDSSRRTLSFDELRAEVAAVAAGLAGRGIGAGDRVAGFVPNCPEAIVAMLATASLGASWSSCSPDFGVNGVVDRFGQIEPRILFSADGYFYNGKRHDSTAIARDIAAKIPSIEEIVVFDFSGQPGAAADGIMAWEDFRIEGARLECIPVNFDHPLFIMFSSGTTGVPKCIVHGHGGTLLQHLKEHMLHTDVSSRDRLFYFTTCGWMMWNWLVSGLASGATLVLYDGSPFMDEGRGLWRLAEDEQISIFGTSAKYLSALEKAGRKPASEFDLSALRTILSTGSPLAPEGFEYVYRDVAADVQLSSIAGGTDIISCFVLGNPLLPVRRGEIQCRGLGMAVDIFDDDGRPLRGEQGELVCTRPFPSAPIGFWNDPDDSRYRDAYFARFEGIWAHGDFAELTPAGGLVIHGRSDAVLNPGGVRIGTAEIYRQVESLDEVVEGIAVGQRWDDDVRVVLFVVLRPGVDLDAPLVDRIRATIRQNTTPRHVPAKVLAVPEIPRTRSGKIVELAVRSVIHGEPVKNTDALANPEALEYFRDRPELDVA